MPANAFSVHRSTDPLPTGPAPLPQTDAHASTLLTATNGELFIRNTFAADPKLGCELLFRQYFAPLCSHAVRFVYDRQLAEDIVADLFFTFYQKELYRQITGSYRAYLYQAVRNRAYNSLRWEMGRQETLPDDLDRPDLDASQPDRLMQQDELYRALEQAVQQLSPQQQRVFLLNRFEGKSYKEIAEALDLAPKTVENHLLRAVSTVRQLLRQQKLISCGLLLLATLA
ncbi:sigma-70 family RNA polymerase sigma factor [Spirosoma validum]|uniref:Sigma-70 family RNA polymerase sigma factor n=1 Tax=Spirosoma validum TaxID=2771355 RepID=A0A927B295_9BACT|nr:sigma-70 family RNA polymerase sigma factor [Spirosoma validum]MBD2754021.1 sigma-70 family RNA polymerase sigma factor [Spirosoma validum]